MDNFTFNELYEDYEEFKEICVISDEHDTIGRYLFNILQRHFGEQSVRYDVPNAFYMQMSLRVNNHIGQYSKQKELLESIYKITLDEMRIVNDVISNKANNPNTEVSNPYMPLNYIAEQNFTRNDLGKLDGYFKALNMLEPLLLDVIINEFKYMFTVIYNSNKYMFKED